MASCRARQIPHPRGSFHTQRPEPGHQTKVEYYRTRDGVAWPVYGLLSTSVDSVVGNCTLNASPGGGLLV